MPKPIRAGYNSSAAIIERVETDDGAGGVVGTDNTVITSWRCRMWQDDSFKAWYTMGQGGRDVWRFTGEPTDINIETGMIVALGSCRYEITSVARKKDVSGRVRHVSLRAELL